MRVDIIIARGEEALQAAMGEPEAAESGTRGARMEEQERTWKKKRTLMKETIHARLEE